MRPRTRLLLRGRFRITSENSLAARRLAQPRRLERPANLETIDARHAIEADAVAQTRHAVIGFRQRPRHESRSDLMRTSLRLKPNVLKASVDLLLRRRLIDVERAVVLRPADAGLVNLGAIERNDERRLMLDPYEPDVAQRARQIDLVLAVGGKRVLDSKSAARAQRQAIDVKSLRSLAGIDVGFAARPRIRPPHRLHRHRSRRGHVLIEKRRRRLQHIGDVVEAVGLRVLRQQLGSVHLQSQECRKSRSRILCDSAGAARLPPDWDRAPPPRPDNLPSTKRTRPPAAYQDAASPEAASSRRAACEPPFPKPALCPERRPRRAHRTPARRCAIWNCGKRRNRF